MENVTAHHNLHQLYDLLGKKEEAAKHLKKHSIYKPDDNARDLSVALAKSKYPAANHAAEEPVIYPLNRLGAPGLFVIRTQKQNSSEIQTRDEE